MQGVDNQCNYYLTREFENQSDISYTCKLDDIPMPKKPLVSRPVLSFEMLKEAVHRWKDTPRTHYFDQYFRFGSILTLQRFSTSRMSPYT